MNKPEFPKWVDRIIGIFCMVAVLVAASLLGIDTDSNDFIVGLLIVVIAELWIISDRVE